jgi:hypothetical protein
MLEVDFNIYTFSNENKKNGDSCCQASELQRASKRHYAGQKFRFLKFGLPMDSTYCHEGIKIWIKKKNSQSILVVVVTPSCERPIINTIWLNNSIHFGLHSGSGSYAIMRTSYYKYPLVEQLYSFWLTRLSRALRNVLGRCEVTQRYSRSRVPTILDKISCYKSSISKNYFIS